MDIKKNPLISIITTLYNYEKYIADCIKSVLDQNYPNVEMIIVDDCSKDKSYYIANKFHSEKVRVIKLNKNRGYSVAKNVGIKASKAEILVMLDADDMLTQNSIVDRYNKLNQGYDLVHGPVLDLKNRRLGTSRLKKLWLTTKNVKYIHAQGVMLRKGIHRKIGLYDEDMWCKSDREMFYRIYNHGFRIGWVNGFVAIYRKHSKQMSKSKAKLKANDKLQKIVQKKIKRRKTDLSDLKML